MPWAILNEVLAEVLARYVGRRAAEMVARLLPTSGVLAFNSPDEMRSVLREQMLAAAYGHRPVLKYAVYAVLSRLNGWLVGRVWDGLHLRGVVSATSTQFAPQLHAEVVDPVDAAVELGLELLDMPPAAAPWRLPEDVRPAEAVTAADEGGGEEADDDTREIVAVP